MDDVYFLFKQFFFGIINYFTAQTCFARWFMFLLFSYFSYLNVGLIGGKHLLLFLLLATVEPFVNRSRRCFDRWIFALLFMATIENRAARQAHTNRQALSVVAMRAGERAFVMNNIGANIWQWKDWPSHFCSWTYAHALSLFSVWEVSCILCLSCDQ